jgi:hypothetical protein
VTIRIINPASPPDLSYSVIHWIVLNGERLPPHLNFWNRLLFAVIGAAVKTLPKDQVAALVTCHFVSGKRKAGGYHYISETGISVQFQNANSAWRATYHILETIRMSAEIEFSWQIGWKPRSSSDATARMIVDWSDLKGGERLPTIPET